MCTKRLLFPLILADSHKAKCSSPAQGSHKNVKRCGGENLIEFFLVVVLFMFDHEFTIQESFFLTNIVHRIARLQ